MADLEAMAAALERGDRDTVVQMVQEAIKAVSYTHLTLPTN